MFKIRTLIQAYILFLGFILIAESANATFLRNFWPKWEVNNPLSLAAISHEEWQGFLNHCVMSNEEAINLVDYPHLKSEDYALLKRYIDKMAKINIDNYNRNEQLAYWINLYNALTVQVIAEYYPIGSIEELN